MLSTAPRLASPSPLAAHLKGWVSRASQKTIWRGFQAIQLCQCEVQCSSGIYPSPGKLSMAFSSCYSLSFLLLCIFLCRQVFATLTSCKSLVSVGEKKKIWALLSFKWGNIGDYFSPISILVGKICDICL